MPPLRLFCLSLKEQTEAAGVALGPTCKWEHAPSHLAALHSYEVESFRFESSVEKIAREHLSPHGDLHKVQETGALRGEETRTSGLPISPKAKKTKHFWICGLKLKIESACCWTPSDPAPQTRHAIPGASMNYAWRSPYKQGEGQALPVTEPARSPVSLTLCASVDPRSMRELGLFGL